VVAHVPWICAVTTSLHPSLVVVVRDYSFNRRSKRTCQSAERRGPPPSRFIDFGPKPTGEPGRLARPLARAARINNFPPVSDEIGPTSKTVCRSIFWRWKEEKRQTEEEMARHTPIYTHPFNGPFSGTTQVSRYQKDKTNLDFTEARDSEWQWHQLGHMQVCTSLQTDNHASTPPLSFLQAGCPSCRPTNSVKATEGTKKWQDTE